LRSKLMDRALSYAEQIKPDTSEWPHTFMWAADNSTTPPFEIPTDMHKMTEQSIVQVRGAIGAYIQFLQRAIPEDITGGSELSHKVLNNAERNLASAFEFAGKLAQVRDFQAVASLQVEFIQAQMQAMTEQAKELSEAMTKAMMDSLKTPTKGGLSF